LQKLGASRLKFKSGFFNLAVKLAYIPEYFISLGRDEIEFMKKLIIGGHDRNKIIFEWHAPIKN